MSQPAVDPHTPAQTLHRLDALIGQVETEAQARSARWGDVREEFRASASNLAAYLAFRQHDLQDLQRALMVMGLSSLGRLESRVLPALRTVRATLAALALGESPERPSAEAFFAGEMRLRARRNSLLGGVDHARPVGLLVTCPTEAAEDPDFMSRLAAAGVEAVRINCAHDDVDTWGRMVEQVHRVAGGGRKRMRIFMDLAGPKIRTGALALHGEAHRLHQGDELALVPPGGLPARPGDLARSALECTLAAPVLAARTGDRVFYDDGKFEAEVIGKAPWGLTLRIRACEEKGVKLKSEKGLNFPDSEFAVDALTEKDLRDLDFVGRHADAVEQSFVQSAADVDRLHDALAARRSDWHKLHLVLKIETARAVTALPELLVRAARRQPTAIMIARGDLALEIGYIRLAEMQEEILWLAEAAQVPTIWATQVLEHWVQKGVPSRGETTDAAMAARAECVMLNKGPFVFEVIEALQVLLARMHDHQHKKTPQLRRLQSW